MLRTEDGAILSAIGRVKKPDAVLSGPAREVAAVLLGGASLTAARKRGVSYSGDRKILERMQPNDH